MKITKLFFTLLLCSFSTFIFSTSFAQSNKSYQDSLKYGEISSVNSIQAEQGDVKIKDGSSNTLLRITDEGTFGAIEIKNGVPSTTTNKLYNDGGTLKFSGSSLGGGSGASKIDDLSDAAHDSIGLYLGMGAGINDDGLADGTPNYNIGIGKDALNQNTIGILNTAIGYESLNLNNGIQNISIGHQNSKLSLTSNYNTIIGVRANYYNQTGDNNTIIGLRAGFGALNSSYSGAVYIGHEAGYFETSNDKLYIENSRSTAPLIWGDFANDSVKINGVFETSNKTITPLIQITTGASDGHILTSDGDGNASWQSASGNGAIDIDGLNDAKYDGSSVFLGHGSGAADNGGNSNSAIGKNALASNISGVGNVANGYQSLWKNTSGKMNTAIGASALSNNVSGDANTATGHLSLYTNTAADSNTAFGWQTLRANTAGNSNTAVGTSAMWKNISGKNNTAIGRNSLYSNTDGNNNTSIGYQSNLNNLKGSNNTIIGYKAGGGGNSHSKDGNVFLGYMAGFTETGNDKLFIENSSSNSPLIWGDFANDILTFNGSVGIQTPAPTAGLHIAHDNGVLFEGTYGSGTISKEGGGIRMMWFPKKAAFRAGGTNSTSSNQWDEINIGNYSVAMGSNTTASGSYSTAFGYQTRANGTYSIALGNSSWAATTNSIAIGKSAAARGLHSTSIGYETNAGNADASVGSYSTAIGYQTSAWGDYSTALGNNSTANAPHSTAFGYNTTAGLSFDLGGEYSTAMGKSTSAIGNSSTAMGNSTNASGNNSTAMGFSTSATGLSSVSMGRDTEANGDYSTAMGKSTIASGSSSTAFGNNTNATGINSLASGSSTNANGVSSTAMGSNTTASGDYSTAIGYFTTASGDRSIALGSNVTTNGHNGSFVIGDYSTSTIMSQQKDNEMKMRFANGYFLYSSANLSTGVYMLGGTSGWNNISDKNKKENFLEIDGEELLNKIKYIPITKWNYKNSDPNIKYIGPMAQDFHKAFHLGGTDSLGINTISIDGVNLAGIKALEKRTREHNHRLKIQEKRIKELENQISELSIQNTALTNQILEVNNKNAVFEERFQILEKKINTEEIAKVSN